MQSSFFLIVYFFFHKTFRYQSQLQKNLLYLAAIADAQPQTAVSRPQVLSFPDLTVHISFLLFALMLFLQTDGTAWGRAVHVTGAYVPTKDTVNTATDAGAAIAAAAGSVAKFQWPNDC